MDRSKLKNHLNKLEKEELVERLVDLEVRIAAAEDRFLSRGGRRGERAFEALCIVRPDLRHTEAAPQSVQIVYEVWLALRDGQSLKDALAATAGRHDISPESVKATYYKHKGPNGLPLPPGSIP